MYGFKSDTRTFEKIPGFFEPISRVDHFIVRPVLCHCLELNDVCQMVDKKGDVMKDNMEFDEFGEELPDAVKAALQQRFGSVPDVPSSIDQSILADARRHFEQYGPAALRMTKRRRVSVWQWTAIGSTVAAACVLFFAMKPDQLQQQNSFAARISAVSPAAEMMADAELTSDVDFSGRVDILDAFAMARQIRSGREKLYDINHDGRFDEADIDIVAREAVKL